VSPLKDLGKTTSLVMNKHSTYSNKIKEWKITFNMKLQVKVKIRIKGNTYPSQFEDDGWTFM